MKQSVPYDIPEPQPSQNLLILIKKPKCVPFILSFLSDFPQWCTDMEKVESVPPADLHFQISA